MKNNELGVLGGMGPFATSVFFERVIEHTEAKNDQEHIDIMILNHATLPDRTKLIMNNEKQPFLRLVEKDLALFEQAGVKNIAIPCNTSHYFYDDIQAMTSIPIIHMVKSTIEQVANQVESKQKVAVLATDGTVKSEVYQKELLNYDLELHHLTDETQTKVMEIIYNVKSNIDFKTDELDNIVQHLVRVEHCAAVVLACTELSTITLREENEKYCVDALDVLVTESIIRSGKQMKKDISV